MRVSAAYFHGYQAVAALKHDDGAGGVDDALGYFHGYQAVAALKRRPSSPAAPAGYGYQAVAALKLPHAPQARRRRL